MLSGISVFQLLIILLIVVLLFGTKKLRNIGADLGGAIRNFRKASQEDDDSNDDEQTKTIEGQSRKEDD
ncbi:MAG: twin-arginine translocase TatA/TatE family subunit [Gammaproteobacteria bacterium]|nr:twin-arginine translocase TatA/TatE family subunit [Gammaproteobacteria bacterium]